MKFETPAQLRGRLKLGREEYCQRLLTTLILHAPYPRWNARSLPAPVGLDFLRDLYERSFDERWPGDTAVFVDEFELPPRHDAEKGGAPDYAVLWDDCVWLIELKTEKGSHRSDQIPGYFELAHHHYPKARVALLYVTPPMQAPYTPDATWGRYAHTTWDDLIEPIRSNWPSGFAPGQQEVIEGLLDAIDSLHLKPAAWRAAMLAAVSASPAPDAVADSVGLVESAEAAEGSPLELALGAATSTAADGRQRAVEFVPADLEDLLSLRLSVRNALAAVAADSPLRHVVAWIWRPESAGKPLTGAGRDQGMELRLSRYGAAQL